jgi:hypothetical protein
MKNMKKVICRVMIIALTAYSLVSSLPASAVAKGVIKPQLRVTGLKAMYKFNSQIKINIVTANYTRKVKYRVSLYNVDSKTTLDLTKGYSKSISGSKNLTLSALPKGSGKYIVKIYVKPLESSAGYSNYLEKTFIIEANKGAMVSQLNYAQSLAQSKIVGIAVGDVKSEDLVAYQMVIKAAVLVNNNFYSSQAKVNATVKELILATAYFNNSVIQPADKTALVKGIKEAQQRLDNTVIGTLPLEAGQVLYTDRSALIKAMISATSVAVDCYATAPEVSAAEDQLKAAMLVYDNRIGK